MSYDAEISRANPACFIFVLDQSGSMNDAFGGGEVHQSKAVFLADVTNRTLHDLVLRCAATEEIRNYYHVAVIGYGASVGSAITGPLTGKDLLPISEVANNPARIEQRTRNVPDGAGGLIEQNVKFPVWIEPKSSGGTPMCAALQLVHSLLDKWVSEHRTSFPPTVLHITDGESTDGDPTEIGKAIRSLSTTDGEVLMFNCHVSSQRAASILYPSSADSLPNDYAKTLFNLSSVIPNSFRKTASEIGVNLQEGARAFVFNSDPTSLIQFFQIGTRPANLR